jgi:LysM domain-containing protein
MNRSVSTVPAVSERPAGAAAVSSERPGPAAVPEQRPAPVGRRGREAVRPAPVRRESVRPVPAGPGRRARPSAQSVAQSAAPAETRVPAPASPEGARLAAAVRRHPAGRRAAAMRRHPAGRRRSPARPVVSRRSVRVVAPRPVPGPSWVVLSLAGLLAAGLVVGLGLLADAVSVARVPDRVGSVQVQAGESLSQVARRAAPSADSGAVVRRIVELNDLDSPSVQAGRVLLSPIG